MQRHLLKFFGGIAAAAALLGGVTATQAAVHTYNQSSRTVNAGVLLFDSTQDNTNATTTAAGPSNADPYMFYVLDQRLDVKPIGWSIINPLAPRTVTKDIIARWDAQATVLTGTPTSSGYTLGQQVTPDMAPYWEVTLSKVTLSQLRKFDILLISARNPQGLSLNLRETEKEMLRQYVDGGGQIVVDAPEGDPFVKGNFISEVGTTTSAGPLKPHPLQYFSNGVAMDYWHPIIAAPNMLTFELKDLGFGEIAHTIAESRLDAITGGVLFNGFYDPTNPSNSAITAGQLGAGQVVLETTNMADAINNYVAPGSTFANNRGPFCGDSIQIASQPDLKLLVNIINWNNTHSGEFGNSHNNAFTNDPIAASVRRSWQYAISAPNINHPGYGETRSMPGSAIYGRYALVVDATGILHCFDINPAESLSGGNPDDGDQTLYKDFNLGKPYDEVWNRDILNYGGSNPRPQLPYCSAPTVAVIPDPDFPPTGSNPVTTVPAVFVANNNGGVTVWRLADGKDLTNKQDYSKSVSTWYYGGNSPVNINGKVVPGYAPAPAYYRGMLFGGRADGRVWVRSFVGGAAGLSAHGQIVIPFTAQQTLNPASAIYVTGSPSVYLNNNGGTNDLMLVVPTNRYVFNMYLGSYGDKLGGGGTMWTSTRVSQFTGSSLDDTALSEVFDQTVAGSFVTLDTAPNVAAANQITTAASPQNAFADYYLKVLTGKGNVWQAFGTSQTPWSKSSAVITPPGVAQPDLIFQPNVSAVAIDNKNNNYYTVSNTSVTAANDPSSPSGYTPNSTLVCTQNATSPNNGAMLWRFRLPMAIDGPVADADGVDYSALAGFVFSGAPVVDENGFVYAVAYNNVSGKYAVLCFNRNNTVSADISIPTGANVGTVNGATVTQPVGSTTATEFGPLVPVGSGPITQGINYTADSNGHLTFTNFSSPEQGSTSPERYPVMSEPESIQVSFNAVSGNTTTNFSQTVGLHTNLAWMLIDDLQQGAQGVKASSIPNGLTVVGDYAFFGDDRGTLYRVYIRPQNDGLVGPGRVVSTSIPNHNHQNVVNYVKNLDFQAITGVVSSGSGSLLLNGPLGVLAYQSLKTLATDADRIFETDADGSLLWTINSTMKPTVVGGVLKNGTGRLVSGRMDFKNPTSISQIDPESYLVADTGNNRVVEFDRSGNVINEITRFTDSLNTKRMLPGDPDTLNHPTSVKAWRSPGQTPNYTTVHYLIADTGNYRIVQVADDFNASGQPITSQHRLEWVSQTYHAVSNPNTLNPAVLQRKYAYTSADLFYAPNATGPATTYVVALISNVSVGPLSNDQASGTTLPYGHMGSETADSAGGTIVLLDTDTTSDGTHVAGYVNVVGTGAGGGAPYKLSAISDFYGYIGTVSSQANTSYTGFDWFTGATDFANLNPNPDAKTRFHLRNPRFLTTYTPQTFSGSSAVQDFLLADDNGAFDLYLPGNSFLNPLVAKWGMVASDYQTGMASSPIGFDPPPNPSDPTSKPIPIVPNRSIVPFRPSSIALIGTDTVNNIPVGRYLITQNSGHGDVNGAAANGTLARNIGGEIFTAEYPNNNLIPSYLGYGGSDPTTNGHTLSRPSNGGALQSPASAIQPLP